MNELTPLTDFLIAAALIAAFTSTPVAWGLFAAAVVIELTSRLRA